jgi:hypothetical protein
MKLYGTISELIDTGLFTLARNPWFSGDLAQIAKTYQMYPKTFYIIKRTPPWSKHRLHLRGLRSNQREVIARFIEKVAEGIDAGEIGKMKPASAYIKRTFKDTKVGRTVKPKRTSEELRRLANEIRAMKPAKAPAMATVRAGRGVEREIE